MKGRHCTSASKSKSAAWGSGLGPNTGFSLESGRDVSIGVDSTYSTWTLMVLGTTGRNDILTSSPLASISALCSTGWYSTVYNSVANKGCHNQTFCLVVLINITGTDLDLNLVTHLFTIIPWGRLWCSACSTRHTALGWILVVHPGTVITEFLEMQIGFFLEPIVTFKCVWLHHQNFVGLFFTQVIHFWGFYLFLLLGYSLCWNSQFTAFTGVWMMINTQLGEQQRINSLQTYKRVKPWCPIFFNKHVVG